MKKKSLLSRIRETVTKVFDVLIYEVRKWFRKELLKHRDIISDFVNDISDETLHTIKDSRSFRPYGDMGINRGLETALKKIQRRYRNFDFIFDPGERSFLQALDTVDQMIWNATLLSDDMVEFSTEYYDFHAAVMAEFQRGRTLGFSKQNLGQPS